MAKGKLQILDVSSPLDGVLIYLVRRQVNIMISARYVYEEMKKEYV